MDTLVRHCMLFVNCSSKRLFWFRFTGKHYFTLGFTNFSIPAHFWCWDSVRGGGGGGWGVVVLRACLEWTTPA